MGSLQISQPSYQNLDQGFVGEPPLHMGNGWVSPPKKTLQPLFPAGEELVNCIHKSETNDLKRQMMLVKLQATMGVLDWGLFPMDFMTLIKVIFCMASQDENLYSNF